MQLNYTNLSQSFKVLHPPVAASEIILYLINRIIHGLMLLVGGFLLARILHLIRLLLLGLFPAQKVVPD